MTPELTAWIAHSKKLLAAYDVPRWPDDTSSGDIYMGLAEQVRELPALLDRELRAAFLRGCDALDSGEDLL